MHSVDSWQKKGIFGYMPVFYACLLKFGIGIIPFNFLGGGRGVFNNGFGNSSSSEQCQSAKYSESESSDCSMVERERAPCSEKSCTIDDFTEKRVM